MARYARKETMSIGGLFGKVEGFFKGAAVEVSTVFIRLFGKAAATQFGQSALALLKTAEGKIAVDAVQAVESLSPTADAGTKKAAAFSKIATDLKAQGLTVGDSIINMLIELAVGLLKGNFTTATL